MRIDYRKTGRGALDAMLGLEGYVRRSSVPPALLELVKLRASYINGCAYCVDMHWKDARLRGESEQRLSGVPVWHETPFFTPRERAALAWTEVVTRLDDGVPDAAFDEVRAHFTEEEVVDLTMAVIVINGWNRLAVSLRAEPGSYQPQAAAEPATVGSAA